MKRVSAAWFLVGVVTCAGAWMTYETCPGCIDRSRVNTTCEWTGDAAFQIDPQSAAHQQHLVADAQLAEELAIRHADAEFGRRFGVEHHGGLIDNGRFRRECLSRMFSAIENTHDVSAQQIQVARGERNPRFDLAVGLLFLPIYLFGASIACRWLFRRFSTDERAVGLIAIAMSSIAVSLLGLQCFRLFAAIWEVVRVGNGHMTGIRAASDSRWSQLYVGADFIGGVLLFWLIAFCCYRFLSQQNSVEPARRPGILLN
jgi:hypothetical protein